MNRIEKDPKLIKLQTILESCNYTEASSLAQKSNQSYETLKTSFSNITSNLAMKEIWDDDISAEINGNLVSGISNIIDACKSPADQIMITTGNSVATLVTNIENYSQKVDEYNENVDHYNQLLDSKPAEKTKNKDGEWVRNSSYTTWQHNCNTTVAILQTLEKEVNTWKEVSEQVITNLKSLLSPLNIETVKSLAVSNKTSENYESSSAEKFGYKEGYTASGTILRDEQGNIISETYYIMNKDGTIVQTGVITYNADGTSKIEEYIKNYENPGTTEIIETVKQELEEKQLPEELAYLNGSMNPESENVKTNTKYSHSENGEEIVYSEETHAEKTFADGTELSSDEKAQGILGENGEKLPNQESEDTTITHSDGTEKDIHRETTFVSGIKDEEIITVSSQGEVEATFNTDYVAAYQDNTTGYQVEAENSVTNNAITDTTTTISSITYRTDDNGQSYAEEVVMIRDNNDPQCGKITYGDNEEYTVSRQEDGSLLVSESCTDKNGNRKTDSYEIGQTNAEFKVVNHETGEVTTNTINIDNPLDQFTVDNAYQTSRMDAGFKAEASMDGNHFLWWGTGETVDVVNPYEKDPSYSFSLTIIDN